MTNAVFYIVPLILEKVLHNIKIHAIILFVVKVTYGQLAQLVEQRTLNPWVQGSSPCLPIP